MEKNVYTGVNLTNFPSEEYFHINSCGMQTNHKQHFTILRQRDGWDFHILYIVKGGLHRGLCGKRSSALPGNFILYPPGMPQRYTFPEAMETITFLGAFYRPDGPGNFRRIGAWRRRLFQAVLL